MTNFYGQYVGFGAGAPAAAAAYYFFDCATACFAPGGYTDAGGRYATIDKTSFSSDGNSTDQGDLASAHYGIMKSSSTISGYCAGGYIAGYLTVIEKFAMASTADSTAVGDLAVARARGAGITDGVNGYGWTAGGHGPNDEIQKYSHASDGDSVDVQNMSNGRTDGIGGGSTTHGYVFGTTGGSYIDDIEKITFADTTVNANIGSLVAGSAPMIAHSTYGSVFLPGIMGTNADRIDKMSTASDSDSVATGGALDTDRSNSPGGGASTISGYNMGGGSPSGYVDIIDKFPFTITSGTSSDVGDLPVAKGEITGGCQL